MARYQYDLPVVKQLTEIVHSKLVMRGLPADVSPDDDLTEIGLSSLDMVNLMLRVESEYDLQIPETEMTAENFRSIARIGRLIAMLLPQANA